MLCRAVGRIVVDEHAIVALVGRRNDNGELGAPSDGVRSDAANEARSRSGLRSTGSLAGAVIPHPPIRAAS